MAQGPGFCPEGEEVKKMDNITKTTKRKKIPPRELRIKAFNDVHKLRKRGLSCSEIRKEIYRKYGVWIGTATIRRWLRGVSSPYNGRYIPSPKLLKPSKDLGYVIGVRLGDGYTYEEGYGYFIGLEAKDKEFVGYCQVGITASPPALVMLCIIAIAVTNSSRLFNVFEFTLL